MWVGQEQARVPYCRHYSGCQRLKMMDLNVEYISMGLGYKILDFIN